MVGNRLIPVLPNGETVCAVLLALFATAMAACSAGPSPTTLTPSPEPAPTATAAPTLRPAATATGSPGLRPASADSPAATPGRTATPPVESASEAASPLTKLALSYVKALSETLGPRESATDQERAAAEYLASQFESFGYSVTVQPFTVQLVSREKSSLVLEQPSPTRVEVVPLAGSLTGEVSGILVPVGLARPGDLPEESLAGKIALAGRGVITFEEKVNRVRDAGAAGVVIYNNQPGHFQGALQSRSSIPAIGISQEEGERLEGLVSAGEVRANILVQTEMLPSRNVVAEKLRPASRSERVLVLGAHFDTVPGVPGANDNASGTAVLLTIASELAREPLPFTLRFVAFGSEELGLLGSEHYVNSLSALEQSRVEAMLNFDALAHGERLGILGSSKLTSLALAEGAARGTAVRATSGLQGGGSDHASFSRVGIPVLMFFAEDFSRIHTPEDTLSSINPALLGDAATLALAILRSPDFLPE